MHITPLTNGTKVSSFSVFSLETSRFFRGFEAITKTRALYGCQWLQNHCGVYVTRPVVVNEANTFGCLANIYHNIHQNGSMLTLTDWLEHFLITAIINKLHYSELNFSEQLFYS